MKRFRSILRLFAEQRCAPSEPRGQRSLLVESLEERCVLSGVFMHPAMEGEGGFGQGNVDCGGGQEFEEHHFAPRLEHGQGPGFPDLAEGEFDPFRHGPPETPRGADAFFPPPRLASFQVPRESEQAVITQVFVVATRLPAPAFSEPALPPVLSPQEHVSHDPQIGVGTNPTASPRESNTSGISIATTGLAATLEPALAKSRVSDSVNLSGFPESAGLKVGEGSAAGVHAAAEKLAATDAPSVTSLNRPADGLIELNADDDAHRFKRKSGKAAAKLESPADERLERLAKTLRSDAAEEPISRLPLPEVSTDVVLASWKDSGPAWSPDEAGLVEILAADVVSPAGKLRPEPHRANSTLPDASAGLHADIGIYQALDLASDHPVDLPIATVPNPAVSTANRQPAAVEKAD